MCRPAGVATAVRGVVFCETGSVKSLRVVRSSLPLWWRVVTVNMLIFLGGTAVFAFGPRAIWHDRALTEGVVFLFGLVLMTVANLFVVRSMLRPLDTLANRLSTAGATDPSVRLPLPADPVARGLTDSVNHLLARIEEGQREAGAAALAGQESERARIAQELHDGVGQSLTAILLDAGFAAERDTVEAADMARIRDTTRAALEEVRRVARQLRPHVLEDLGLRSALASLTQELFSSGPTHVVRRIDPGLLDLDDGLEVVVFRIAQEALTNVARHAGARTVELRLSADAETIRLEVVDDGRGVPDGAEGTGLRGMRERAALVRGSVRVERAVGGGTRVLLEAPMTRRVGGTGETDAGAAADRVPPAAHSTAFSQESLHGMDHSA